MAFLFPCSNPKSLQINDINASTEFARGNQGSSGKCGKADKPPELAPETWCSFDSPFVRGLT